MAQQPPSAPPQGGGFDLNGLWNFLGTAGFPAPQAAMAEVQRLNNLLEMLAPDIHKIAGGIDSMQLMAQGLDKLDPEQIQQLIAAMNGASATGDKFFEQLWGNKK